MTSNNPTTLGQQQLGQLSIRNDTTGAGLQIMPNKHGSDGAPADEIHIYSNDSCNKTNMISKNLMMYNTDDTHIYSNKGHSALYKNRLKMDSEGIDLCALRDDVSGCHSQLRLHHTGVNGVYIRSGHGDDRQDVEIDCRKLKVFGDLEISGESKTGTGGSSSSGGTSDSKGNFSFTETTFTTNKFTITGDLTVLGKKTTITTEEVALQDNVIALGSSVIHTSAGDYSVTGNIMKVKNLNETGDNIYLKITETYESGNVNNVIVNVKSLGDDNYQILSGVPPSTGKPTVTVLKNKSDNMYNAGISVPLLEGTNTLLEKSVLYKTNTNTWDINSPMIINPEDNNETLSGESLVPISFGKKTGLTGDFWYMLASQNNLTLGSYSGDAITINSDSMEVSKNLTVSKAITLRSTLNVLGKSRYKKGM